MSIAVPASVSTLFAQGAGAQQGSPFSLMVPMVLMLVIFYFMGIRPQQQKAKQLANLIKELKRGDKVLLNGGIIASVLSVGDTSLTVRSAESKLEVQKSAVAEVLERSTGTEKA